MVWGAGRKPNDGSRTFPGDKKVKILELAATPGEIPRPPRVDISSNHWPPHLKNRATAPFTISRPKIALHLALAWYNDASFLEPRGSRLRPIGCIRGAVGQL
jgi:hypothetical protein